MLWGVGSIANSTDSLPLEFNKLPQVTSDFHETLEERSARKYLQIDDYAKDGGPGEA